MSESNQIELNQNNADTEFDINDPNNEFDIVTVPAESIYSGLILKNDYVLLKKIGSGNNAGVWLAYQSSTKLYLAIKVQDERCYKDGCREVVIIKNINEYCNTREKNIHCVSMLDYFVYEDNKNQFVCSVYELYAGNIKMILNKGKYKYGLPLNIVKSITKQMLIALSTLHNDLKIIHTDIKPENILLKGIFNDHKNIMDIFDKSGFQSKYDELQKEYANDEVKFQEEFESLALFSVQDLIALDTCFDNSEEFISDEEYDSDDIIEGETDFDDDEYDEEDEYDESDVKSEEENNYNECDIKKYNTRDQSVEDIIEHIDYSGMHNFEVETDYDFNSVLNNRGNSSDNVQLIDDIYVNKCETALTDFGNAYFYDKRTRNEIQDRRYRCPEVILDLNYGYGCDIWSLACVVFELATGFGLFEPDDYPLNMDIHHLYLMEKLVGPIPVQMKKLSKRKKFLFDKQRKYHIKNLEEFEQYPMKQRLAEQYLFSEKDAEEMADFIMSALKHDPAERASAEELLNHPWIK